MLMYVASTLVVPSKAAKQTVVIASNTSMLDQTWVTQITKVNPVVTRVRILVKALTRIVTERITKEILWDSNSCMS